MKLQHGRCEPDAESSNMAGLVRIYMGEPLCPWRSPAQISQE